MYFRTLPKLPIPKALVSFLLAIVLVACGANSTVTSPTPAQTYASSTASTRPKDPLSLNPANISFKEGNLLIQSQKGFLCPSIAGPGRVPGQLVFTSDPTTYSQAEIEQIRVYLNSNFLTFPPSSPPSTLRWVLGGSMGVIPAESAAPIPGAFTCGADFTLTNTGNTPIQIPKVGVQLQARPQQNAFQYRLINACSLWPPERTSGAGECPPTSGGGGNCNYYDAPIQLGQGEKNTVFSAVPSSGGDPRGGASCGTLTLAPAAQKGLNISFSLAPNAPGSLIYSVVPIFTIDTNQGEQTQTLLQLASTLAFADVSQFSCYGLQGTAFVREQSPFSGPTRCL